jgi:hypothetical protein
MNKEDNPAKMFEQLSTIVNRYNTATWKIAEEEKIAVVIGAAPKIYQPVLTGVQLRLKDKMTLEDLKKAMNAYWRSMKGGGDQDGVIEFGLCGLALQNDHNEARERKFNPESKSSRESDDLEDDSAGSYEGSDIEEYNEGETSSEENSYDEVEMSMISQDSSETGWQGFKQDIEPDWIGYTLPNWAHKSKTVYTDNDPEMITDADMSIAMVAFANDDSKNDEEEQENLDKLKGYCNECNGTGIIGTYCMNCEDTGMIYESENVSFEELDEELDQEEDEDKIKMIDEVFYF